MIYKISPLASSSLNCIDYRLYDHSNLQIALYDKAGKLLRILLDGFRERGFHSFTWDSGSLTSGQYFVHFRLPNRQLVKKIQLI